VIGFNGGLFGKVIDVGSSDILTSLVVFLVGTQGLCHFVCIDAANGILRAIVTIAI